MALKDWKKVDDDYVQRIYFNKKNAVKIIVQKPLTGRIPKVILKLGGIYLDRREFYSLREATKFAKKYMETH